MSKTRQFAFTEKDMRGMAVRLAMLQTHYRKPKDFKFSELNQCAKTLRRWLSIVELGGPNTPPLSVLLALSDDLNTPQAIAEMHKLASSQDGKGLFAAMCLLGLIPGEGRTIDYDIVSEVKTIPIDHIPLVQWSAFHSEFPAHMHSKNRE